MSGLATTSVTILTISLRSGAWRWALTRSPLLTNWRIHFHHWQIDSSNDGCEALHRGKHIKVFAMAGSRSKGGKNYSLPPTKTVTEVAVDPAELDAVLLNLLNNAVYWLSHQNNIDRRIEVQVVKLADGKRVSIEVCDSGPGVADEDAEKIFWPGVTNKPGGIGMGLTVASEIIAAYDGKLGLNRDGKLGGATFFLDLPLK